MSTDGERAGVYADVSPVTGKPRLKCERCGKVVFDTEERAAEAADQISERTPMRAYFSEKCGWYHVTRQTGNRKGR